MADIVVTETHVGMSFPSDSQHESYNFLSNEAITAGQAVYILASGKLALTDASVAGTAIGGGIALNSVDAANEVVQVLKRGYCDGFTVSALSPGDLVELSDTAGALDSGGAPTVAFAVGRVQAIVSGTDTMTNLIYFDFDWLT